MITAFLILLLLYLAKIWWFAAGSKRATTLLAVESRPSVSVIVAARNEEHNMDACLQGLASLRYPGGEMEIIVVDDQSTDSTAEIISSWCDRVPHMRMLETTGTVHDLKGKANAIAQAIEKSTGEIILTSDADCVVPAQWVEDTVAQYDEHTGCVCGFTLIRGTGMFAGMQAVDWAYLLTIASAGVGWHRSLSAVGNNMSFRRQAYEDVGGYQGVGFSVTEDFALFKAISYETDWVVRYPVRKSTLVWSEPCETLQALYSQKKRWGRGGLDIHPIGFAIMSVGFLMNAAIMILPFLGFPLWTWLIGVIGKILGDAYLLAHPLKVLGQRRLFRYFFLFELYYLIYVTVLPFVVVLGGRVVWKDRKL